MNANAKFFVGLALFTVFTGDFGWLYLQGRTERLNELFSLMNDTPAEKES